MAMVGFSNINSMLDDEENKRGTDVLSQPSPVRTETEESEQPQAAKVAAPIVGGGVDKPQQVKGQPALPSTAVAQAVIAKNKATPLKVGEETKQKIKDTQTKLIDEASKYTTGVSTKASPTIDEKGLKKTFETGEGISQVGQTLSQEDLDIPEFTFEANLPEREIEALKTREGQEQLLVEEARKYTPQYTTGMAALDIGLSRKEPTDYSDVITEAAKIPEEYKKAKEQTEAATKIEQQEFDTKKQAIRDYLKGLTQGQRAEDVTQLTQAQQEARNLRQQFIQQAEPIKQQIVQELDLATENAIAAIPKFSSTPTGEDMITTSTGRQAFIIPSSTEVRTESNKPAVAVNLINAIRQVADMDVDANNFITSNIGSMTADNFISPEEATRFNRVMELLGEPTRVSPGTAPKTTFNDKGFRDALSGAVSNVKNDIKAIVDSYQDINTPNTERDAAREALVRDLMAKYGIVETAIFEPAGGTQTTGSGLQGSTGKDIFGY